VVKIDRNEEKFANGGAAGIYGVALQVTMTPKAASFRSAWIERGIMPIDVVRGVFAHIV
jgi:hypothetical protein